ncbi:universal stress protein [Streptomyces sp. NBC_00354]|uniref:universal stress protein n=1 Tax=Streptomyces sp. NBC_00354 TaxID=2975723 RepID=UPI002E26C834
MVSRPRHTTGYSSRWAGRASCCRYRRGEGAHRASAGAKLLVVGSGRLGGFAGLLPGSVSQQYAAHAACQVVIVRRDTTSDDDTTDRARPALPPIP